MFNYRIKSILYLRLRGRKLGLAECVSSHIAICSDDGLTELPYRKGVLEQAIYSQLLNQFPILGR